MPIEFSCPGCRKILRVADSAAGKKARCPDCSTVSDVPHSSQTSSTAPDFSSFGSGAGSGTGSGESSWSTGNWSPSDDPNRPAPGTGGSAPTGNPFAQKPTPHESSADNPFASPQPSFSSTRPIGFEEARERVKGPAICLMVVSGISIALTLLTLAVQLLAGAGAAFAPQGNNGGAAGPAEFIVMMSFGIVPAIIQLIRAGFMIYGATQMKNLENHSLAMATAIMAVVPCFSACCLMDLPFGIWALVVLNDPQIKQAFQAASRQM